MSVVSITRLRRADMEVSINCGSDWKTFGVLLTPGQRLKKISNWFEVGPLLLTLKFPRMQCGHIPECWLLVEVADKKELFKLLHDYFGRTFHLSWHTCPIYTDRDN